MTLCVTPGCTWLSTYGTRFCLEHLESTGTTASDNGGDSRYFGTTYSLGPELIDTIPPTAGARAYAETAKRTEHLNKPAPTPLEELRGWVTRIFESLFR